MFERNAAFHERFDHTTVNAEHAHNATVRVHSFAIVQNEGDADSIARLWHSFNDRSEGSTLMTLTKYNHCFETLDGLLKEKLLGTIVRWLSFPSTTNRSTSASRRQSLRTRRCHSPMSSALCFSPNSILPSTSPPSPSNAGTPKASSRVN